MKKSKEPLSCPEWSPYHTYIWTLAQLRAWYDQIGEPWAMYDGRQWFIKHKKVCSDRYSVKFVSKV